MRGNGLVLDEVRVLKDENTEDTLRWIREVVIKKELKCRVNKKNGKLEGYVLEENSKEIVITDGFNSNSRISCDIADILSIEIIENEVDSRYLHSIGKSIRK